MNHQIRLLPTNPKLHWEGRLKSSMTRCQSRSPFCVEYMSFRRYSRHPRHLSRCRWPKRLLTHGILAWMASRSCFGLRASRVRDQLGLGPHFTKFRTRDFCSEEGKRDQWKTPFCVRFMSYEKLFDIILLRRYLKLNKSAARRVLRILKSHSGSKRKGAFN